ncbi:MAG: TetR family transcriptional regulator [Deltaproteobacteria bacterium]|nr:TetR family transcriptional regulator [Deltaproteobacteria bacterium]MBI3388729.1 TetR family transcriptional regulator [Deltaproteobacteria bacterium]
MATVATLTKIPHHLATDGRVRRSQRSGHSIVEALLQLVGEGSVAPTAQQVAVRAGVGIRTVFRRFSDMESLFAEMDARLQAEALPLLLGGRPEGRIEERARALVRQRAALFERIAPFKRSGNLKRQQSPFLQERHALLVRQLRADLRRWLPELRRSPADLINALDLALSFEAWDRLRVEQRLSRERAQAAVEQMVLALVAKLR